MSKACPKCGGGMDVGYIPETKDQSTNIETWCEGEPKKAFFGLNTQGVRTLQIQTWRCNGCGFLESYAPAS